MNNMFGDFRWLTFCVECDRHYKNYMKPDVCRRCGSQNFKKVIGREKYKKSDRFGVRLQDGWDFRDD